MPQTPKSSSATITSATPTTIYTVPTATTAVVKSVIGTSVIGGSLLTLNKTSSGTLYPVTIGASTQNSLATGNTPLGSVNLLASPITLAAGESLSVSTSSASAYKFPTTYTAAAGRSIKNVFYINSTWIALGTNTINGLGLVLTSTNGTSWTEQTFSSLTTLSYIAFAASTYVAIGSNPAEVFTSSDLITWTKRTTPNTQVLKCVAYNGTNWLAAGNSGAYISTTTATSTWTAYTLPVTSVNVNSVAWLDSKWVFGTNGSTAISTNSNGSSATFPYSIGASSETTFGNLKWTDGYYYGFASSYTYQSTNNGVTWTQRGANPLTPTAIAANGSYLVLMNSSASYWSSDGGSSWSVAGAGVMTGGVKTSTSGLSGTYLFTINNAGTGGVFAASPASGGKSAWSNYSFAAGFVFAATTMYQNASNTYSVIFGVQGGTTLTTYYANLTSGSSPTANSNSTLTVAAVGTPYIATLSGGVWYTITNTGKILSKSSATNATITNTGNTTPSVTFVSFAISGTTYVGVTSAGVIYTSSNSGGFWQTISVNTGGSATVSSLPTSLYYDSTLTKFILTLSSGSVLVSNDGITWTFIVNAVQTINTLNSQNLFISNGGLFSSTTPAVSYTNLSTLNLSSGASINNSSYISSTYYFTSATTVTTTTNLSTFTTLNISSLALNDITYVTAAASVSDGTNLLTSDLGTPGKLAYVTSLSSTLQNAYCTAGIVEIS
jgi:hypothetical protein